MVSATQDTPWYVHFLCPFKVEGHKFLGCDLVRVTIFWAPVWGTVTPLYNFSSPPPPSPLPPPVNNDLPLGRLNFGLSGPDSSPGQGHCIYIQYHIYQCKTMENAKLYNKHTWVPANLMLGDNPLMCWNPIQLGVEILQSQSLHA